MNQGNTFKQLPYSIIPHCFPQRRKNHEVMNTVKPEAAWEQKQFHYPEEIQSNIK